MTAGRISTAEQALSVIEGRWVDFVGRIAMGALVADALKESRLTRPIFEGLVRTSKVHKTQYDEAKTSYLRTLWDDDTLDGVLGMIAAGSNVADACAAHNREAKQLHTLVIRDPFYYAAYEEAMKIKALHVAEELTAESDDTSDDLQLDGRGNNAAVKRSELKIDTRKFIMSAWLTRVFGKNGNAPVNVNVTVNHAERLQEARARRDRSPVTIEARPAEPVTEAAIEPPARRQISHAKMVEAAENDVPEFLR
jgi:hypothetical protein